MKFKHLLYSIIFIYSSLFSYPESSEYPNSVYIDGVSTLSLYSQSFSVTVDIPVYNEYYSPQDASKDGNIITLNTNCVYSNSGPYNKKCFRQYFTIRNNIPCEDGYHVNEGYCVANPPPSCSSTQFLNDSNICEDINASYQIAKIGYDEATCKANIGNYLSAVSDKQGKVISWDNASQKCIIDLQLCSTNQIMNNITNECENPPKNLNCSKMDCGGDNCGFRGYTNLCGSGATAYAPSTYDLIDTYNLQEGHNYAQYACITDYRKIKFFEVSCTDIIPEDNNYTYQDSDFTLNETLDTNISNLEAIDPEKASLQNNQDLKDIESAITDILAPKIDITNQKLSEISQDTNDIKNGVDGINIKLGDTNLKLDGVRGDLNTINDSLNQNGGLNGGEDILNKDNFSIDSSALDDTSIMDNLADNLLELTDGMTSIKTEFDNTKNILSGNQPVLNISSGSCSDENLLKFASYISPYSAIFALLTYIGVMISIFKMIFAYFARGE